MTNPVKVLYIEGWGRSGTTILANLLGQLDGFVSVGEVRYIWDRGFLQNRHCGCGKPFLECDVWSRILEATFPGRPAVDALKWKSAAYRFTRTARVIDWLGGGVSRNRSSPGLAEYLEVLGRLYTSIATVTGSHVIVDSSKFPVYGATLRSVPDLDVYFAHMVRDPRAVAYSWSRPKQVQGEFAEETIPPINPVWSSLRWTGWNMVAGYFARRCPERHALIRYEDFAREPRLTIAALAGRLGERQAPRAFTDDATAILAASHTISGNPDRFGTGTTSIAPDTRWLDGMPLLTRFAVSCLTFPLLRRYGYSFWV